MSVSPLPFAAPGDAMPWRRCLVLVLALHLLAAALLWPWRDKAEPPWVPPPAVMVVMAAAPQAPAEVKQPPGQRTPPPQVEPPAPQEPLPTVKVPEAVRPNIAVAPKQKKSPKPVKKIPLPRTPPQEKTIAPPRIQEQSVGAPPPGRADKAAAPQTRLTPYAQVGEDSWRSRINGRLNRFKRYPKDALRLKRQGVGQVRFTLDRQGHVLAVTLVSSAGLPSLDREIQALVKRASPLPTPPADAYVNDTVELTLPIDFSLRGASF
ncbi:energy transducer TonB [Serratia marcescens]|uniref:energy transducer TonB n=1 Tax=Serratia TaxID=613 RepID=UPI0018694FD7|nr:MULTISPECIES: TonB family protein [Serratia]MBH2852031.1 energy transducer TonB [Serratia marcescens]MDB6449791.1 TonB family protein [Serratia sp. 21NM0010]